MIIKAICEYQNRTSNSELLIMKFNPIFKKYAFLLDYEGAYHDLVVEFLKFITSVDIGKIQNTSDGAMVNYITKVILTKYIILSKNKGKNTKKYLLVDDIKYFDYLTSTTFTEDIDNKILMKSIMKKVNLSQLELIIIDKIFFQDMSVSEISKSLNTSRQNVNQIKNNALKKMACKV